MPLYEYRCLNCKAAFEVLQNLGKTTEGLICPECGDKKVEKQFSTFAASTGSSTSSASFGGGAGCGGGSGFS
ncbi:MAG: zinc ribbon domain-containing protein [Thermoanaerobaculia bacterium]